MPNAKSKHFLLLRGHVEVLAGRQQSGRHGLQAGSASGSRRDTAWLCSSDTLGIVLTVRKAASHCSCGQAVKNVPVGRWSPRFSHCAGACPQLRPRDAALSSLVCRDKPKPPCSVSAWVSVFPKPENIRIQCLPWPMVSNTLWPHFVPINIIVCLSAADFKLHRCNPGKTPNSFYWSFALLRFAQQVEKRVKAPALLLPDLLNLCTSDHVVSIALRSFLK